MNYIPPLLIGFALFLMLYSIDADMEANRYVKYLEKHAITCKTHRTDGPSHTRKRYYTCDNNETIIPWRLTDSQKSKSGIGYK